MRNNDHYYKQTKKDSSLTLKKPLHHHFLILLHSNSCLFLNWTHDTTFLIFPSPLFCTAFISIYPFITHININKTLSWDCLCCKLRSVLCICVLCLCKRRESETKKNKQTFIITTVVLFCCLFNTCSIIQQSTKKECEKTTYKHKREHLLDL